MTTQPPSIPSGTRLYAIGDIHGCLDLLERLLSKIEDDCRSAGVASRKIFLGDYIDRGLKSRGVIDFLIEWQKKEKEPPVFLLGNHEQVMRGILLNRDVGLLENWLSFGGRETLMSYGIRPSAAEGGAGQIIAALAEKTPETHIDFLRKLKLSATFGDYYFCHAGVRPGIPLTAQKEEDLIWIRQEFLDYAGPFGKVVVHGHSIRPQAEFKLNRIGIDTGAYATGQLTALALEGTKRWLIQTG
jgi:serine/threonine protein phosphatase 1